MRQGIKYIKSVRAAHTRGYNNKTLPSFTRNAPFKTKLKPLNLLKLNMRVIYVYWFMLSDGNQHGSFDFTYKIIKLIDALSKSPILLHSTGYQCSIELSGLVEKLLGARFRVTTVVLKDSDHVQIETSSQNQPQTSALWIASVSGFDCSKIQWYIAYFHVHGFSFVDARFCSCCRSLLLHSR